MPYPSRLPVDESPEIREFEYRSGCMGTLIRLHISIKMRRVRTILPGLGRPAGHGEWGSY